MKQALDLPYSILPNPPKKDKKDVGYEKSKDPVKISHTCDEQAKLILCWYIYSDRCHVNESAVSSLTLLEQTPIVERAMTKLRIRTPILEQALQKKQAKIQAKGEAQSR